MTKINRLGILLMVYFLGMGMSCNRDDTQAYNSQYNGRTTAVFNPQKSYGQMADVDGNLYKTIKIGNQTWMAENLRVTHFRNGEEIPLVTDTFTWTRAGSAAFCNYNNTEDIDTIATYGRLYNWYAASDPRNIAPEGWRVATIDDWNILIDYLGGDTIAANKLKETGNFHWQDPFESDNSSGFTALPGGRRYLSNSTKHIGYYGVFWTQNDYNGDYAPFLYLYYYGSEVNKGFNYKVNGYSIRCIKE